MKSIFNSVKFLTPAISSWTVLLLAWSMFGLFAHEADAVRKLTETTRESIVTIQHFGRDGGQAGEGTGFVVAEDGLIATSLHVIGEARPVRVRLFDGSEYPVEEVHAWDRQLDLAVVRIPARNLRPIPLGNAEDLKQGQRVAAIGNPLGLAHSVVEGIVSAFRDFDGIPMIQLAIPIEPGNSGGPLLDLDGAVHGVLTLKYMMASNLGFAVSVSGLKRLLENPNPIPMNRWVTIGALNSRDWQVVFGAHWTQQGRRISVEGLGESFGGRALCLSKQPVPELPFEMKAAVKLDDESGAAGLLFCGDGKDRHYGFYPSNGRLRLTRFDGPSVYTWNILRQIDTAHYREGEWNELKVRLEADRILCFVNGHLVIESDDATYRDGSAGLAKFRDTRAEFRDWKLGQELEEEEDSIGISRAALEARKNQFSAMEWPEAEDYLNSREPDRENRLVLSALAERHELQARRYRRLAERSHHRWVEERLTNLFEQPDSEIGLTHAALCVSLLDNPELDVNYYLNVLDAMAEEIQSGFDAEDTVDDKLRAIRKYLFTENGFHGSRLDYNNRSNSYINEVLDFREGLPITLSLLYMELARRCGLPRVEGIGLPGHFIVRETREDGSHALIDPFKGGVEMSMDEARRVVLEHTGRSGVEPYLEPMSKRAIVLRMVRNLLHGLPADSPPQDALKYQNLIVALQPDSIPDRLNRIRLYLQTDSPNEARRDLQRLIDMDASELDTEQLKLWRDTLEE